MAQSAVAYPYAKALLDLAVAQNELAIVREEIEAIDAALAASEDLRNVFANPVVTTEERRAVVRTIAENHGMAATTRNVMLLLADKRRLGAFSAIAREFGRLADAHQGIERAEVRSPVALDAAQEASLKATLEKMTGGTVELTTTVDPSLIGGIRVRLGDTVYDASIASRLQGLRESILRSV